MTRKYVENWLLWVVINVISVVVIFCFAGRLCDVAGISDPDIYRRER